MTQSTVVFTDEKESQEAGNSLGIQILNAFGGEKPHVVILFASSEYAYEPLLQALQHTCAPAILVGCSSAGEFTHTDFSTNSASAVAIHSTDITFSAGLGKGITTSRPDVVEQLYQSLRGVGHYQYPFQSGLLLADALSGHTDEIIDLLTEKTGSYQFFGGGAGDNANFSKTHVFFGTEAFTDAAVLLEILSSKPLGIGVQHGWQPTGEKMRVTAAEGSKLISLNGIPAEEIFREHALDTQQEFDPKSPVPFFLHNILGIEMGKEYKLRVPLAIQTDGSVVFASDIPVGALVSFMSIAPQAATEAALKATTMAMESLKGSTPEVALFFDCVATRLRMGNDFRNELEGVKSALGTTPYAGCNTYGQVARLNGQKGGFHNCNAVICIIPQ